MCAKIAAVADMLLPQSKHDDVLHNLMMSTILGFVVDEAGYAVFGCGDGLFVLNGFGTSLDSQQGNYLAAKVLAGSDWKEQIVNGDRALVVHRSGPTSELNHLLIATDGVEDLQDRFAAKLAGFIANGESEPTQTGLCRSIAWDFRALVWRSRDVEEWAKSQDKHDDRSFIVMRRTMPQPLVEAIPTKTGKAVAVETGEAVPTETGENIAAHK
jgi:hypothetical protein